MGRPRGFDEVAVVQAAAELFGSRTYDGISIDELVTHLGVHRNSLYKTFGSKRGLYMAALRWSLDHKIAPLVDHIRDARALTEVSPEVLNAPSVRPALDLLLLAAVERAPVDAEVADLLAQVFTGFDQAAEAAIRSNSSHEPQTHLAFAVTAALLGLHLRARSGAAEASVKQARTALVDQLTPQA
ncbi:MULTISPECIES: TetR/AcrR family transcriptional regulator [Streptosporangium]|uniref:TetR/AcrR family transcriptional repressor of nem operon n=1 Tax=Streptosporangium brasiliense TaxID=47480 RepID=A0ABT9RCT5_9ACTN|nr:TetR/AcrR family transcriptional regulator [Streptosporangium brasiliense]MDP9867078.1 TetR/AcrR family transcriptional repressor of nem operon [Streptosporangium brasiliense]